MKWVIAALAALLLVGAGVLGWTLKGKQIQTAINKQLVITQSKLDSADVRLSSQSAELINVHTKMDSVIRAAKAQQERSDVKVHLVIDTLRLHCDSVGLMQLDALQRYHDSTVVALNTQIKAKDTEMDQQDSVIAAQIVDINALHARITVLTQQVAAQQPNDKVWKVISGVLAIGTAASFVIHH